MRNFIQDLWPKVVVSAIVIAFLLLFFPETRQGFAEIFTASEPAASAVTVEDEEEEDIPVWDYYNPDQQNTDDAYVLNRRSFIFHLPSCVAVPRISPAGYDTTNQTREELIADGYQPCGRCHP